MRDTHGIDFEMALNKLIKDVDNPYVKILANICKVLKTRIKICDDTPENLTTKGVR